MEISGSSIRHRTGVPKAQSSSETDSLNISPTIPTRTLQQTLTEADNATARQSELIYKRSGPNERDIDHSFEFCDQIRLRQPTEAQKDSDGESGISISSHQSKISISSHKTKTNNASPQQKREVGFLDFVNWGCEILPEVSKPVRKIELKEKRFWTVIVLLIFMVCCQCPLFGFKPSESVDRLYHMRVTRASHRGTPMEFGIMLIANSHCILLMLTGFKIIKVHDTPRDHALLNGAQKLYAFSQTVAMSVIMIMTGLYCELENIGVGILISIQLIMGGLIIILLNDLVRKGYCLGTEISLFMVANICATIMWKAFSPLHVITDQGPEFEGAFVSLLQLFSSKKDNMFVLKRAFLRQNLPNIVNVIATFFVFAIVIYLKGFRVQLPMRSTIHNGQRSFYPINLLYTSVAPLHLQLTFVPNLNLISQDLSSKYNDNFFVNLFGVWADVRSDGPPRSYPIGGLCYYLSPPRTPLQVTQDPVYAVVYTIFMIGSCALYSRIWINLINISAVDVAKELKDKNMVMRGHGEQTMLIELNRYIPTAAVLGGLCIGALSVLADFLGVIGRGEELILVAIILYEYAELYFEEKNVQKQQITLLF